MSNTDDDDLELPVSSSELGKKEYWDQFYTTELENFDGFGEEGVVWFGKRNLERIDSWLTVHKIDRSLPVLDIGCGNGMTLITLAKEGYEDLTGIDYSDEAIQLAKKVSEKNGVRIKFYALDFLKPNPLFDDEFVDYNVIIDKGTYDAICLDGENVQEKREQYIQQIKKILSPDGYFLIFSCNWTKDELLLHFKDLQLYEEMKLGNSICFGGKTGQTVTILILCKNVLHKPVFQRPSP